MRRLTPLALVCAALAGAAGCARVQAAAPGPSPLTLDVPAPPPRVVVPPSADVADPPPAAVPATPAPTAPARPSNASAPPARTTADKPATPTAPPPPEATATPALETTPDVKTLDQQTRSLLASANKDLKRVDLKTLSSDAQAQYRLAQSFVKQAENALAEKNLTYARNMAEKAAALASQLPKTGGGRLAPFAANRPTAP